MEFVNYIILVFRKTFEIIFLSICPFLLLAYLMQIASSFIRNKLSVLIGAKGFAYFTAIGVIVHELGHWFFAVVFRHKIVDVSLFNPQTDGTLGYVTHSYNPKSIYQRIGNFFIGTGPIWGGVLVVYFLSKLLLPETMVLTSGTLQDSILTFMQGFFSWEFLSAIKSYIYLYLVFVISLNITLSPPDIKSAFDGFIVILISLFLLVLSTLWYVDIPALISNYSLELLFLWLPISAITFFILFFAYSVLFIIAKFKG